MKSHGQVDAARSPLDRWLTALAYAGVVLALVVPVLLQSWATALPDARGRSVAAAVVAASLFVALVAAVLFGREWRGVVRGLGNQGLATIGMISGLHFAVSYASRIAGYAINALIGPFYIFIAGVTDEGLPSLLLAVLVVLLPRPGVVALSMLTVFVLNGIVSGQFGLISVLFVAVSIALNEGLLAALGVTLGREDAHDANHSSLLRERLGEGDALPMQGDPNRNRTSAPSPRPSPAPPWKEGEFTPSSLVVRVALAIGIANASTMLVQYCLFEVLYRLAYDAWYVAAVTLVPGLLYGTIGAALGAALGLRLRRTAL
jgi:hypothetical protein